MQWRVKTLALYSFLSCTDKLSSVRMDVQLLNADSSLSPGDRNRFGKTVMGHLVTGFKEVSDRGIDLRCFLLQRGID